MRKGKGQTSILEGERGGERSGIGHMVAEEEKKERVRVFR